MNRKLLTLLAKAVIREDVVGGDRCWINAVLTELGTFSASDKPIEDIVYLLEVALEDRNTAS